VKWAQGVAGLEHAPGLDPVVGSVTGIGPALFAYLRMRSGANALKPDLRVARALRKLGFYVPVGEHAILLWHMLPQTRRALACWLSTSFSGGFLYPGSRPTIGA
jgi:hypothetical protein